MVKISAFADEVTDDFEGQVNFLKANSIQYLEIRSLNGKNIMDLNRQELAEAKARLDNNGISVSAIGSPIGKVSLSASFDEHLKKFAHAVEVAGYFGAPFIRLFSYYAPEGKHIDDCRDEVIRRLSIQAGMVAGTDVVLAHENESHIYGYSAEHCADIAHAVNSAHFRLVYDPANFVWGSGITDNMSRCWPLVEPYVAHVHIKDWKLGSQAVGAMPGEGDGQIGLLLSKLASIGYDGFITLEPHLESGGQFGGSSGPLLFRQAVNATRALCEAAGLAYS